MGAEFAWHESNQVGEVVTEITNLNFGNVDQANIAPVASYPITAGEYSYEKWLRGYFTGVYTSVSNLKFWKSAGSFVTDEDIKAAVNAAYRAPIKTLSDIALNPVPTSEGTALVPNSPGSSPSYSGYIILQLQTSVSTPAGAVNQKVFTLKYDET